MGQVRLTFPSEGFEAVSRLLVEKGLSFHVEPVGTEAKRQAADEAPPPARQRTPVKTASKAAKAKRAARPAKPAAPAETAVAGAERLRAAIAQSGAAYRSVLDPAGGMNAPAAPAGAADTGDGGEPDDKTGD